MVEIIGFIGGSISVSSGLPQIFKCIKTGKTRDLSYATNMVSYVGSMISMYYGIRINHSAIIFINIYSMIINSILLSTKIYFEKIKQQTYQEVLDKDIPDMVINYVDSL